MCGCVSWSGWPNWISEAETISKGFREDVLKKEGLLRNVGDGRCIALNRGTSVLFILDVRGLCSERDRRRRCGEWYGVEHRHATEANFSVSPRCSGLLTPQCY